MLNSIIRTKIIPPPRHARILARPRVTDIFKQAFEYRLTLLQAEAGYGKSIALAELAETVRPIAWYQVNEEDNDPLVFLLHRGLLSVNRLSLIPIFFPRYRSIRSKNHRFL